MNVNLGNGWGIVRTIADLCLKQPEGKYVLVKNPNKVSVSFVCSNFGLGYSSLACIIASPSFASTKCLSMLSMPRKKLKKTRDRFEVDRKTEAFNWLVKWNRFSHFAHDSCARAQSHTE